MEGFSTGVQRGETGLEPVIAVDRGLTGNHRYCRSLVDSAHGHSVDLFISETLLFKLSKHVNLNRDNNLTCIFNNGLQTSYFDNYFLH